MHVRLAATFAVGALLAPVSWSTEITRDYTFQRPNLTSVVIDAVTYTRVSIAGAPSGGNPGQPRLPAGSAYLLIPYGEVVTEIRVTGTETLVGDGYLVEPAGMPFAISKGPTEENIPRPDQAIYGSSDPFPASRYASLGTHEFRGYDILVLRLEPCKYIPTTGALYYYPTLHVSVQTATGSGRNTLLRFLTDDAQAAVGRVDNPGTVSTYPAGGGRGGSDYDLLILTTPALANAFAPLAAAHNNSSPQTLTQVKTLNPPVTWDAVRTFIGTEYNTYHIKFALIGADDDALPAPKLYVQPGEPAMPSDFYLGCLDGAYDPGDPFNLDLIAEVYIGRAAADNAAQVTCFVNKTVAYLNGQHTHLNRVLQAGEWLGFAGEAEYGSTMMDQLIDVCSAYYTTYGIPSATFDIDRLYDAPGTPDYRWPMNELIRRMNAGVHWINHLGHARPDYGMRVGSRDCPTAQGTCGTVPGRVPVSDLAALTNTDYFFIYSDGCEAGWFDGKDCVAEAFTTGSAHGAFAVIMNARTGWAMGEGSDYQAQRFHRWFWDAIFNPDPHPALAYRTYAAANQYVKEKLIPYFTDVAMRYSSYELNYFGDPSLVIRLP